MATHASTTVPATLTQAIHFLTRPLILIHAPAQIISLQLMLQTTLLAVYRHSTLTLTLSPASLPPRPIYAACIAAGVRWSDWIRVLGGRPFDLAINPAYVTVRFARTSPPITIWQDTTAAAAATLKRPVHTPALRAVLARAQSRTLAQQILEAPHEADEANEIFAMISSSSVVSPTPTSTSFTLPPAFNDASPTIPESVEGSVSSRPSSRASDVSDFSFAASDESFTSASSAASAAAWSRKPAQLQLHSQPPSCPVLPTSTPPHPASRRERAHLARARVFIDSSRTEVQRYKYEGGLSTVLTGGVMLGGGAAKTMKSKAAVSAPLVASWRRPRV